MANRKTVQGITIPKANPGTTWTWIINLLIAVLAPVLAALTPMLRTELEKFAVSFYKKAEATPNPWDDFLAAFLVRMLGLPLPN
jgi:RsiW-degrading membrane proteinase PrsW (M82 family)